MGATHPARGGHTSCKGGPHILQWGATHPAMGGHTSCNGGPHILQWGATHPDASMPKAPQAAGI
eukprot:275067-Chlamydomonas_euryale.AAC.3